MFSKIKNIAQYLVLRYSSLYKDIYILNDNSATCVLNKLYDTKKFKYLPDPVNLISEENIQCLREELQIKKDKTIFLHCGSLSRNKGTLDILEMIKHLPSKNKEKYTFIFAGVISEDIKVCFYKYYDLLQESVQIIVYDSFCSYELLASLFLTSDIVLCPYRRTSQSSGIIGYAAQFEIPVIIIKGGLLSKLVKKNNLGVAVSNIQSDIDKVVDKIKKNKLKSRKYIKSHKVSEFTKKLLKN